MERGLFAQYSYADLSDVDMDSSAATLILSKFRKKVHLEKFRKVQTSSDLIHFAQAQMPCTCSVRKCPVAPSSLSTKT